MRKYNSRRMFVFARGFTLIEVLVVVAIIALLISILLPSLATARETAKMVACRGNVHQIGLALSMYTGQFGYFPGHHLNPDYDPNVFILWPVRLMRFMNSSGNARGSLHAVYQCPDSRYKKHWDGHQRLFSDVNSAKPNDCTSFDYGINDWGVSETHYIPGAPNLGLGGHIVNKYTTALQVKDGEVRLEKVKRPAELVAIADNDADDPKGQPGVWDTAIDPINDGGREWPGSRHLKGCNVLWADAHADFQLQAKMVAVTHQARRRWNNDFRAHCELWKDTNYVKHTNHPEENLFNR